MSMQDINKSAVRQLEKHCLMRNKDGGYSENVEGFFRRVSSAAASADARYDSEADTAKTADSFFELLTSLRFMPGSLTLLNAGRSEGQLASCFVLPVEDSMESIFEAVKNAALIYKTGGNIGFSFSHLRKSGSGVTHSAAPAGGPISFMRVFNAATEAVRQETKPHGENLAVLRIDHPDIEAFIHCHENMPGLDNFHTAVIITDEFMKAAERGKSFKLISPRTGKAVGSIKANEMFVRLVDVMRRTGAPFVLFESQMQGEEAVAPCGDQPLAPFEACNIGSINLAKMLKCDDGVYAVDYELLRETVSQAVHFLDNIIDVNSYPFEKISHATRQTRKIGLGVMGFADLLWYLGIPYNSDDAVELAESLMAFINAESHAASFELAEKRGAFPTHADTAGAGPLSMRNKTVTAIAPERVVSEICECAEGIEPRANVLTGEGLHPLLKKRLVAANVYSAALEQQIVLNGGTLADIDSIPDDIKDVFTCADKASPVAQLELQAAFQINTDGAVSQAVRFAPDAGAVEVADVFLRAHDMGCLMFKAMLGSTEKKITAVKRRLPKVSGEARPAPDITSGITERFRTPCGNMTVTISYDALGVCEVYTHGIEQCGCKAYAKAAQRLADLALRSGVPAENVCTQLRGIKCEAALQSDEMRGVSCPDALASVIDRAAALSRNMRPADSKAEENAAENASDEEKYNDLQAGLAGAAVQPIRLDDAVFEQPLAEVYPTDYDEEFDEPEAEITEAAEAETEIITADEDAAAETEAAEEFSAEEAPAEAETEEVETPEEAPEQTQDAPADEAPAEAAAEDTIEADAQDIFAALNLDGPLELSAIPAELMGDGDEDDEVLFSLDAKPEQTDETQTDAEAAPEDAGEDKAEDESAGEEAPALVPVLDAEPAEEKTGDMGTLLDANFFEHSDAGKLAQSIFASFAENDKTDAEPEKPSADALKAMSDTGELDAISLDFGFDADGTAAETEVTPDTAPAPQPSPEPEDETICAVCGSKADIVGDKIICPVCGFTRVRSSG